MASAHVVLWERCSKVGKWCPYSAEVSLLLEKCYKNNLDNVCLGDADVALKIYTVNLKHMNQVSEVTGTKCAVRRQLYEDPVLERGFIWQWQGDGHDDWHLYEIDVNNIIECAFLQGKKIINLSREHHRYNYLIDFTKMLQINKRTKRKRSIRRTKNVSYPCVSCEDTSNINAEGNSNVTSNDISKMQSVLSDIDKEIPGTAALEAQVNEYMRNVSKNPLCENLGNASTGLAQKYQNKKTKHSDDSDVINHAFQTEVDKCDLDSNASLNAGSKVALVNGKPWNDAWPPHTPESKLKPVPGIDPLPKLKKVKQSKNKRVVQETTLGDLVNVIEQYTEKVEILPISNEEQVCIICYEALSSGSSYDGSTEVLKLSLCSHIFHKACLDAMYNSGPKEKFLQCPSCKKIHGEKCGIQPPGNMIYHVLPYSLAGYSECDTIRIIYDIHSGIQGPEHPNPGKRYTTRGFPRHCYLPDNEKGRKVLRLLIKAWKRRLIFTIGRSSTTGEENTVTWNEIHHKTEFGCNRRGHGYPDPNYLDNVLSELEAHGVIDDEVFEWHPV